MGAQRDPLSVRYDGAARSVLLSAVRAHKQNKGTVTWVQTPARSFGDVDAGGLTRNERAFQRSLYYQVDKVGDKVWSLKLTWDGVERRGRGVGRTLRVRLYRPASGYRHVAARPGIAWWRDPARQSKVGSRAPAQ